MQLLNPFKQRWVMGMFVGLLVTVSVSLVVWLSMPATKQVRGFVDLRDRSFEPENKTNEDYENYRKTQTYLLKTRDLLNRTVHDPALSSLDTIRNNDDPVRALEEDITVTEAAPSILAVSMKGSNLDDMRAIVDSLMKRYVDDATAADRRDRTEQIKKLEKLESVLMDEIEAAQKYVISFTKAGGITGIDGPASNQELFLSRVIELDKKTSALNDEITQLESQLSVIDPQLGWYKITDKTLESLKQSETPDLVCDRLKRLKDKEYRSRRAFTDEINGILEEKEGYLRRGIFAAASMPETQRPIIPEPMINKALNDDLRVVKLKKELEELEGLLARELATSPNPKESPSIQDLKERVKAKEKDIEAKKSEIRSRIVASIKSILIITLEETANNLESTIATNKTTRDRWKQEAEALRSSRGNVVSNVEVAERVKAIAAQRETLEKVQLLIVQNRVQIKMDNQARVREMAQPLPDDNPNKRLLFSAGLGVATFAFFILLIAFLEWGTRCSVAASNSAS